ncbi:MAG: 2-oxoacid:acceptor oxidoreductase subunit alpha, partial [Deltaproteobacteria bacterium]|nr:2-oxoacid:acceptor oxidoreductase subunit alpha [Deltaproteobacteria bacterium]
MTELPAHDISIVLGGEAGQGIQTIEQLLTKILKLDGYHIYATKEYMSRVRGGTNSISIRVASHPVQAPVQRIDLLIPLDSDVIPHLHSRISEKTIIIGDQETLKTDRQLVDIPFKEMAKALGDAMYANTMALGMILGLLQAELQVMQEYLEKRFADKGRNVVEKNIEAARQGYEKGLDLRQGGRVALAEIKRSDISNEIMVNGSESIALGAIAGGCQCITSYPMTPGTGVITFMAQHMHDFDLLVEQAEDELAAINMALGAWYAGARTLVTTSGGGFALMSEGISLAGMVELPVVIHLAQRPGPATGLPTRTEQGDLELALYAGHGEFPRIILAPESLASAFVLSREAFNLADKFQVPVIILSDQYLVDTYYNTPAFAVAGFKVESQVVETTEAYQRYQLTEDGISPRGLPGGPGLVCVDSDEHNEAGHITEDLEMRVKMVDKRLKKLDKITDAVVPPTLVGASDYKILLLSWGSTNLIVSEAVTLLA